MDYSNSSAATFWLLGCFYICSPAARRRLTSTRSPAWRSLPCGADAAIERVYVWSSSIVGDRVVTASVDNGYALCYYTIRIVRSCDAIRLES